MRFDISPQDLYRHLDVCEALGTTVLLCDWGLMPEWLRVPGIADVADPLYAESIGAYLDHLIHTREYRCLRYFIMVNEPNWEVKDFALWRRGLEQVAAELKRRGLDRQIQIAGSDEAHAQDDDWHFQAVDQLKAGESKAVEFKLGFDSFKLMNIRYNWVVEPGEFRILVGSGSRDIRCEGTVTMV